MTKLLSFILLALALAAPPAQSQAGNRSPSSIETIAGGESTTVPGREFDALAISGLAVDPHGNIYFSIQSKNRVFRLDKAGLVTVFAGNGARGREVNGVSATDSPLLNPGTLAADAQGDIYISCFDGLIQVDPGTMILSTLFDTAYSAQVLPGSIGEIEEMAVGPDGKLYFSDGKDWRIKSYSFASHKVTVLAGNGTLGPTQTDVPATSTPLKYPQSVAVAHDGSVYFSTLEPRLFRVAPGDGALQAIDIASKEQRTPLGEYDVPHSIALDEQGHLFVAQANRSRVLQITRKNGAVTVYAGTGEQGFNGDGIPAERASLSGPLFIAQTPDGNLIFTEGRRIRSVDSLTHLISTRAGNSGSIVDDPSTLAFHAKLWEPAYAVASPDGSIYITSSFNNRLMRLDRNGDLVSVAGGGNYARVGSEPGLAAHVALTQPQGIWVDSDGEVFFSDNDNRIVRHLGSFSSSVKNFAVTPKNYYSAGLFLYYAGALVSDGNYFYLSDPNGPCVWRVSRKDGGAELYVGKPPGAHGPASEGGPANLAAPSGLALDSTGNLYIADGALDTKNGRILRVEAGDRTVSTVLSDLRQPSGLAFRSSGVLCFAESGGNQVSCLDLKRHTIRIVAGTGVAGFSGDGGPAECAQLNRPSGISFDLHGKLYIADTGNQRIRRVSLGREEAHCRQP